MLTKMALEIAALWLIFFLYMWILTGRGKGKLGAAQFSPERFKSGRWNAGYLTETRRAFVGMSAGRAKRLSCL